MSIHFTLYTPHSTLNAKSVVAAFSVLIHVKTLFLNTCVNTQAVYLLYAVEEYDSTDGSPKVDDDDSEELGAEESETVAV